MACLNMVNNNNEQQPNFHHPSTTPRISFSNDFVDIKHEHSYKEAPVSSDFQFSLPDFASISADEIIFKGKLLPPKKHCGNKTTTTLQDELHSSEDDECEDVFAPRFNKITSRWKERLGFIKRSQALPSKACELLEKIDETNTKKNHLVL